MAIFTHKSNRGYIVDSGASFHLLTESSLTKKERATIREIAVAIPITTANGEVIVTHQCPVFVQELGIFVWAYILDCSVAVLSLGMLCDEHGFLISGIRSSRHT